MCEYEGSWQNHSFVIYVDDLNLFGRSRKEIEAILNTTRIFNQDIGMEFGLDNMATLAVYRGKIAEGQGLEREMVIRANAFSQTILTNIWACLREHRIINSLHDVLLQENYADEEMIEVNDNGKEFSVSLLDAMNFIPLVWREVSRETIANCFKHAGFFEAEDGFDFDVASK